MKPSEIRRDQDAFVLSFLTIRRAIGFLGILLPAILLVGCGIMNNCDAFQDSISHYYYTAMGDVFVGTLCAVALFLITYKGYRADKDNWINDNTITNVAGIAAIGIAFFATNQIKPECTLVNISDNDIRIRVHYICSAVFFVSLAYMSAFRFIKTNDTVIIGKRKASRNKLYRWCAVFMMLGVILVLSTKLYKEAAADYNLVFWFEWLALLAFGISWLTKGEFLILKDVEDEKTAVNAA